MAQNGARWLKKTATISPPDVIFLLGSLAVFSRVWKRKQKGEARLVVVARNGCTLRVSNG